jgi:uncharacterized protein (UPF0335 family)
MAKSKEAATIGDNSSHSFAKEQLASIVSRIEKLEEEKKAVSDDIRDLYAESKGQGYDAKVLRAIVKMRKMDADERAEQAAILDLYLSALGMLSDTPLGQAAISRATTAPSRSRQPAKLEIEKILDAG